MSDWYDRLVSRFGSAVPPAEHLAVREDLQPLLEELFAALAGYHIRIYGIAERTERLVVIDARVSDDIAAADKMVVYRILEEYQERVQENTKTTGYGFETTQHVPCPFCAAPEFMVFKVMDAEEAMNAGATCGECGRSARMPVTRTPGTMWFEMVQTGGPDQPEWLYPKIKRVS